ncbi:Mobile element protein [Candidatus Enterovibrio escicola]|uniref:Mobile element protein n=1 Tax=Candidatus Enterovibrio escicola TaxID=1927127 RepID=A0A2A5T028_9GAMM|nr:Mobile element protein [Candidatus Enterovibrio escacola]
MGKAKHKISNWKQYHQALVNRGSVTFWIDVSSYSGMVLSKASRSWVYIFGYRD